MAEQVNRKNLKTAKQVKERYLLLFDELNVLEAEILTIRGKKEIVEYFNDILIDAYIEGFVGLEVMLGEDLTIDNDKMLEALNKEYDGITIQDKIVEYVESIDAENIKRLVESEWHRVYGQAQYDGAIQTEKQIIKVWNTVGDEKVRLTHSLLDSLELPLDEMFYTIDGDSALYPSGFEKAENNSNCRCWLEYKII